MIISYLNNDSAGDGTPLTVCLKDVAHAAEDGYTDMSDLTLEGTNGLQLDEFGPTRHNMADQPR